MCTSNCVNLYVGLVYNELPMVSECEKTAPVESTKDEVPVLEQVMTEGKTPTVVEKHEGEHSVLY